MVLLLTCKLGLHQLCKPDGLALHTTDENTTNAIKGSASQIFDLRHSFVVKSDEEMEEQTKRKGIFNSPEVCIWGHSYFLKAAIKGLTKS